jgi:hypothetical protein
VDDLSHQEFQLGNGQRLRVAGATIARRSTKPALVPDVSVEVSADAERIFYADAYANLSQATVQTNALPAEKNTPTNAAPRKRLSEADLVRARRESAAETGEVAESAAVTREDEPEPHVLRDPALARAVDLLKGLTIVRATLSK